MTKDHTKLYEIDLDIRLPAQAKGKTCWHNARPLPYYGLFYRLRDAWNVLWLKADALYWMIESDK